MSKSFANFVNDENFRWKTIIRDDQRGDRS